MNDHLTVLRKADADYQILRDQIVDGLPALKMVVVNTPPPTQRDADETCFNMVTKALREKDQYGWVRFQSGVDWTGQSNVRDFLQMGPPLYAEWTTGINMSCRLRADPDRLGEVRIWTYTERDLVENDDLQEHETAFLREIVTVLGNSKRLSGKELVYHIYWAAPKGDNAHALRRVFDRFAGFQTMEGK